MDILYIIGEGCSLCNNNELRYSLRSIEKFGKNISRVFVAGYCPDWLSDEVVKLPCEQPYPKKPNEEPEGKDNLARKHANMLATLLYAVDHSDIGEEFLISMDDHIYIREIDFDNYPFYCKGGRELPVKGRSAYHKFLAMTRKVLEEQGLSTWYSCLHRNTHLCRRDISECREYLDRVVSECIPLEYDCYLTNYRHTIHADFYFTPVADVKLRGGCDWWKAAPRNTEVFSTYDFEPGVGLDCLIGGMFDKKSKYEL